MSSRDRSTSCGHVPLRSTPLNLGKKPTGNSIRLSGELYSDQECFGMQEVCSISERSANYSQDTVLTEATCWFNQASQVTHATLWTTYNLLILSVYRLFIHQCFYLIQGCDFTLHLKPTFVPSILMPPYHLLFTIKHWTFWSVLHSYVIQWIIFLAFFSIS